MPGMSFEGRDRVLFSEGHLKNMAGMTSLPVLFCTEVYFTSQLKLIRKG